MKSIKSKFSDPYKIIISFFTVLFLSLLSSCVRNKNPLSVEYGRWVSDIPFIYPYFGHEITLTHDNRIYESEHFLIFSDASSDQVKKQVSGMAEFSLKELKQTFGISESDKLGIVDQDSKVKIYLNRYRVEYSSQYFTYGYILDAPDSPYNYYQGDYIRLIKHELMHVFQHLLGLGLNGYDDWPEVWFSEGIAEYVSGGVFPVITSLTQTNQWYTAEDHINPISIHQFADYPVPNARIGEYYPMFELAIRFLIDENGQGKNVTDIKLLYDALKEGIPFHLAFDSHIGFEVDYYEDHFYERISEFLR